MGEKTIADWHAVGLLLVERAEAQFNSVVGGIPLSEATRTQCRYPARSNGEFYICGRPVYSGSFCELHAKRVYRT
jgi:hypothetical protein